MNDDVTARLSLPLMQPGQAQKEMVHNEALALIDLAVAAAVVGAGTNAPPADPPVGASWIVGAAPSGDWAGRASALATWSAGGWRFLSAFEGLAAWDVAGCTVWRFVDGVWEAGAVRGERVLVAGQQVVGARAAAIADVGGGTVVDAEARVAIGAVLAALREHGLIAA